MKGSVYLNEDSAFYPVFAKGLAPVLDTAGVSVALAGSAETGVYMLDLTRCSAVQVNQIAKICEVAFGTVANAVLNQMHTIGMPIRKSQTSGIV